MGEHGSDRQLTEKRDQQEGRANDSPINLLDLFHQPTADVTRAGDERPAPGVTMDDGRVRSVTYPDGRRRSFGYDADGRLSSVTQPDGSVWTRAQDGALWSSNTGKHFIGAIEVTGDGTYKTVHESGVTRLFKPDGSRAIQEFTNSEIKERLKDFAVLEQSALKAFPQIDVDKNDLLSREELCKSEEDHHLEKTDRLTAKAMHTGYEVFVAANTVEKGFGLGISRADLSNYRKSGELIDPAWWDITASGVAGEVAKFGNLGAAAGSLFQAARTKTTAGAVLWGAQAGLALGGYSYLTKEQASHDELMAFRDQIQRMIDSLPSGN